ncbi:TrmH family RNA methyltransferase [Corynebacterium choanae]|uniref:TrmH family RNA methyltransferase n=1 Tax=Corynebacterium choanae TaxID=1862358 RepID=UPI001FEC6406|nr:RNA methyltransferase [Corynebacterium choanae]
MLAPIPIDDPLDPRLDDIRSLNSSDRRPDLPGGKGLVIAEGTLVGGRLLQSRCALSSVVGVPGKLERLLADPVAAAKLTEATVPVYSVSREVLAQAVGFDVHRGLLITAHRPKALDPADIIATARTVVVCEGVGDHENIGAIFRNAAGLGVDGVLFGAGCADPLYRRSVRVSMGHVLTIPFAHFHPRPTTWQRDLAGLTAAGFRIVSLTPNPQMPLLREALVDSDGAPFAKIALMVGAEGPGLSEHAMRASDIRARIPMAAGTDSLNVATAAAIALYERQRSLLG